MNIVINLNIVPVKKNVTEFTIKHVKYYLIRLKKLIWISLWRKGDYKL